MRRFQWGVTANVGLRFAVILLSKTVDVGRDHLIHRKRFPFTYEGKALTRSKVGETPNVGRDTPYRGERSVAAPETCNPLRGAVNTFPYEGKGDRGSGG